MIDPGVQNQFLFYLFFYYPVFVMFLVAIEKNISQFVGTVILMGKGWLQKK